MKRLFLFAVTALAAIACNKSELEVDSNTSLEGTPITITVEMPSSEDTKVEFDQSDYTGTWVTKWSEGDALTAYNFNTGYSNVTASSFELSGVSDNGKSATFTGTTYEDVCVVLFYIGSESGNLLTSPRGLKLGDKIGLSLANQNISLSTTDNEGAVTENSAGALGEYSYMVSDLFLTDYTADYNTVTISHLTALMELKLQLTNLPDDKTFSVSEVQIGVSQADYDELVSEMTEAGMSAIPTFATLYNEEYYDIEKRLGDDGFATASEEMGVYNLTIEGCEITSDANSFTIPFNAFPFMVKQGEYFDITVVLTQSNENGDMISSVPLNFSICNDDTGTDLEFGRGKHHTISYSYTCDSEDFEYIWDGENFESVEAAKAVLDPTKEDDDVYYIGTAAELAAMSYLVNNDNSNYGAASYSLVTSIDLNSKGWTAIGTSSYAFKGEFDGNNRTISGLYINSTSQYQGLFGYVDGATIENLTVGGSVKGSSCTGGIIGQAAGETIINNCHNTVSVTGTSMYIGGILGCSYSGNSNSTLIINCSNTGTITAPSYAGGITGYLSGYHYIVNCYNLGEVKVTGNYVGGIASYISNSSATNCYNAGAVSCSSSSNYIGGVVGCASSSTVSDCYWLSGVAEYGIVYSISFNPVPSNEGATEMSDVEMQSDDFTTLLTNGAYFYNATDPAPTVKAYAWANSDSPYPIFNSDVEPAFNFQGQGTEEEPYLIASASDLRQLSTLVNAGENYDNIFFEMTGDIDLNNEEFTAIGNYVDETNNFTFQGTFDGGGYEVSGLYINSSSVNQGLFGAIAEATIKNLGVSGSVTGASFVGGIVGRILGISGNFSNITNCYNKATIKATGESVGGIVGYAAYSNIANCYNLGSVSSSSSNNAGGITGNCNSYSTITNCYNTGAVSASRYSGGIIGALSVYATNITNCYNIGDVSATNYYGGIAGSISSYFYEGDLTNCYWLSDVANNGIGYDFYTKAAAERGAISKSESEMQASGFTTLLNNGAYTYNNPTGVDAPTTKACSWVKLTGYPTLDFDAVPTFSQLGDESAGTGL